MTACTTAEGNVLRFLERCGASDGIADEAAWVDYFNQYQDSETGYYLGADVPPRDPVACLCPTLMLFGGAGVEYRRSP